MKKTIILIILFWIAMLNTSAWGLRISGGGEGGGGAGTVTTVGDGTCSDGACLDGSADGGTYIYLYDGATYFKLTASAARALTLATSGANTENLIITLGANDNTITLTSGTGASTIIADAFVIRSGGLTAATAGGASIGTTALPFSSIFIGDAATNNVQLINTAAASAVVLTLPDTTGTIPVGPTTITAGKLFQGTTTAGLGAWSTPTYPSASGTLGQILVSDGTNNVYSTGFTVDADGDVIAKSYSSTQTTVGQYLSLLEGSGGGTNFRKWLVPDALTADLTFLYPDTVPTAGQVMSWGAPSTNVSTGAFVLPALSPAGYQVSFTGPTAARSYALPDAATTILTTNAAVTVAQGGTNATSASITTFNNITGYTASGATGTTSTNLVFSTSPTLITPILGVASATSLSTTAGTTTGGYIRLLEGSDNGTDYSMITGIANAGTTAAFTFGGSSTTENLILTIPATTATEATVTSTSGITSIDFTAINIKDVKIITADIDNEAMTVAQMGQVWTNTGDSNGTVFTLPEASTVIGRSVTFVLTVAQVLNINPADGADTILYGGCAAGDSIQADAIGESITLMAIDATNWAVLSVVGTWTDAD